MQDFILIRIKKIASLFLLGTVVAFIYSLHSKQINMPVNILEKEIVIIVPSYNNAQWLEKNLESLVHQNYHNYRIIYIDDASTHNTALLVEKYITDHQLEQKITLIKNSSRKGALENIYNAVHSVSDNTIIVTVDGDDQLKHPNVLSRINYEYQNPNVWMTYGQFEFHPSKRHGVCRTIPAHIIQTNSFRKHEWYSSHLRTFYAWLFKSIKKDDLLFRGKFFSVTWDMAFMFPLLEMAGTHHSFIRDVLYVYNEGNPLCDHAVRLEEQTKMVALIRSQKAYTPIKQCCCLIFSYDRPLQLYALLESMQKYIHGLSHIYILYRTSNQEFEAAYQQVKDSFGNCIFIKQNPSNKSDFKHQMLNTLLSTPDEYILFSVDDIIVKDHVDVRRCIAIMERESAYGFYLRLGKNIRKYDQESLVKDVALNQINEDVYSWIFKDSPTEWRYAHTVDMTIYKKEAIKKDLFYLNYQAPNSFEAVWSTHIDYSKKGICFSNSKIVNIPINRVQEEYKNSSMNLHSSQDLLEYFNKGLKIDISPLHTFAHSYPHADFYPQFIAR